MIEAIRATLIVIAVGAATFYGAKIITEIFVDAIHPDPDEDNYNSINDNDDKPYSV